MIDLDGEPHVLSVTRDISDLKMAEETLRRQAVELASLNRISRAATSSLSPRRVIEDGLEAIVDAAAADMAMLFLVKNGRLVFEAGRPLAPELETETLGMGQCLCGITAERNTPLFSADIRLDPLCTVDTCKNAGLISFASLPLVSGDEVIGVVGVGSSTPPGLQPTRDFPGSGVPGDVHRPEKRPAPRRALSGRLGPEDQNRQTG